MLDLFGGDASDLLDRSMPPLMPMTWPPKSAFCPAWLRDIIGRHFKQPKEGLGFDNSSVAHMWRTMINPERGL